MFCLHPICTNVQYLLGYVIRGKTSRATHPKPPFVDGTKKSRTFLQYSLGATDHRINFVLVSTMSIYFLYVV